MRAWKYAAALCATALVGMWALHGSVDADDPVQLTVGSASQGGDLVVTGQTYAAVQASLQHGDTRIALPVPGLTEVTDLALLQQDDDTHTIWFAPAGDPPTPSDRRLGVVIDWSDAADTAPTVVAVLRYADGTTLDTIEPRWDGGTAFDSVSVLLAGADGTIAASDVAAGAADLLGLSDDLPEADLVAGASVAGTYLAGSDPDIDAILADNNAGAVATVSGVLTDEVSNLVDGTESAGDLAALSVAVNATELPLASWVDDRGTSIVHSFDGSTSVMTRVEDVGVMGTTFTGSAVLGGGTAFTLFTPTMPTPFGMDALLGGVLNDVELTLAVDGSSLSGSLGFTLPVGAGPDGLRVEMALDADLDSGRVAGSLAFDGPVGLGELVTWLSQQSAFSGLDLGSADALDAVQLGTAELSFATSADGVVFTAFAHAGITLTGAPVEFDVLLSVVKPTGGSATALVSLRSGAGVHLGDIIPVPEGPVADLELPKLTLITSLGGDYSVAAADLGPRATAYLEDVFGTDTLDDPFEVGAGITLRAELSVASFGDDVAAALGWDPAGDVVLEGHIGLDFEQLLAPPPVDPGTPPTSAITELSLSATIPNGDAAPTWVPDSLGWPTGGEWLLNVSFDNLTKTFSVSAGLEGAEVTLPGDDSPLTLSLSAGFSKGPDGLQVDLGAEIGDWETPFGVEWLTINSASLSVSITKPPAPAPAEITAGFEGSMDIGGKNVEISVELNKGAEGLAATIRLALNDPVSIGEIAAALGEDLGEEGAVFESLSVGPAELVVTVGGGGWSVESTISLSWDPYADDNPIAANILLSLTKPPVEAGQVAKPTRLVLGIHPEEDVTLGSFLPDSLDVPDGIDFPLYIPDDPTTDDVDESSTIGFVYSSAAFKPFELEEGSITRTWFGPLFAGDEPETANVVQGFSVYGALPVPDAIKPLIEPLGLSDESQLTGKLPIGSGAAVGAFSLSMGLQFDPARLPTAIHAAGLSLQVAVKPSTSEVSISLKGSITFAIEQGLRGDAATFLSSVGVEPLEAVDEDAECPRGGVVKQVDGEFYCHDLLTLSVTAEIAVSAGEASFTLIGDVSSGSEEDGWHPFGIDWFALRQLTATFGITADPAGATIDFGLAGNVDIGGKNISAAVKLGIRPILPFPFLTIDFDGFRAAAPDGLSFGDIVEFANAVLPGDDMSLDDINLPDIGLRNLSFSLSPKPDGVPDLCIAPGLRVQADLYIDPPDDIESTPTPLCDPQSGVPIKPGPSTSCADRRSEGCFAGILLDISNNGIIGQGSVAPFSIGPIVWEGGEIDLALTSSDQHLKVKGKGSITVGTAKLVQGEVKLNFTKTKLQYYGAVALLNGAFNVMVDGEAGIGVFNGGQTGLKLHVLVATSSANIGNPSMGQALVDGLASGLQELNTLVDGLDNLLTAWENAGGKATQLLTELPTILKAVGITVPSWVVSITDAIKYINEVDVLDFVNDVFDAALNGVTIELPTVCFGLLGCIPPITIPIPGLCDTIFPSAIVPATGKCTLPSIAKAYITPLFRAAITAAVDGLKSLDGSVLDKGLKALFDGIGKVARLDCAEFYTDLGPGASNTFALQVRGAVFGEPVGLSIDITPSDFTNLGDRIDEIIVNLVENIGSGSTLPDCTGYKPDLFGTGQADPEAPPLPVINVVGAESVPEGGTATVKVQMTGNAGAERPLTLTWGDGSSEVVNVSTTPKQFTHVYADDDPTGTTADAYTITVRDGSTTQSASDTIAVTNVLPTVSASFASQVDEGSEVSVVVSVTDPGADSQTVLLTWGDGTSSSYLMAKGVKSAATITAKHTYADDDPSQTPTDTVIAKVSVVDDDLGTSSSQASVVVNNVSPVVHAGGDFDIDELGSVTVHADFSDVGLSDTHGYIVNWGDGQATSFRSVTTVNGAGSITESHQYGDDGVFTITVSVGDDDTGQGSDTAVATVHNVNPTSVIDEPVDGRTWILADGVDNNTTVDVPTMLATAGVASSMTERSIDPGSDDETVVWTWGDNTLSSRTWLNAGPGADPDPSTSVNARSIIDTQSKTWTTPCLVQVGTTVVDDDWGVATDSTWVVVTGQPTKTLGNGGWQKAIQGSAGAIKLTSSQIACYLRAVDHLSPTFGAAPDAYPLATVADAVRVLGMSTGAETQLAHLDRALLSGWLELMNGGVTWNQRVDTNGDKKLTTADMTIGELLRDTESLRIRPGVTSKQLQERRVLLDNVTA